MSVTKQVVYLRNMLFYDFVWSFHYCKFGYICYIVVFKDTLPQIDCFAIGLCVFMQLSLD